MKRHDALKELSREHHLGLMLAVNALRAVESGDAARMEQMQAECRQALARVWEPHFHVEERDLLPLLRSIPDGGAAMAERIALDHAALRSYARAGNEAAALQAFAQRMKEHIRFEEREAFPAMELVWERDDEAPR